MAWVKLDDSFFRNTKVVQISAESRLIYLAGLCYASASLSDGFVPKNAVKILAAEAGVTAGPKRMRELVDAGLWVEKPDGYAIHDYLEHNSSADDVREKREQARGRMQRKRSREHPANIERTSREVREPDTDTDTEILSPDGERGNGADAPTPATDPDPDPGPKTKPRSSAKPSPPTRGTRLPADFQVTRRMRTWARDRGLTDAEIDAETEKFREWWPAQPGQKGVKADWQLTWQTWMRRAFERPPAAPVPIRGSGRPPANIQTHGHDESIDWEGEYALPAQR